MPRGKRRITDPSKCSEDKHPSICLDFPEYDDEEVATTTTKRVKQEKEQVLWEWEDDGHVWTKFSGDINNEITTAFKGGLQNSKVMICDKKFDIMFDRMVQRNSTTFWERRIRANKSDEDGGMSGTFCYSEKGTKTKFDNTVQRLIYAALCYELKQVTYTTKGQKFTIDLVKMEQTNAKTKKSIKIHTDENEVDNENEPNDTTDKENKQIKKDSPVGKKTKTLKKNEKVKKEILSEEEEVEEEKPKAKVKVKKEVVKSISFTGKCPVDSLCPVRETHHVYYEGATIYDSMLNQTNLKNNNNKYFLLQILKSNKGNSYAVWLRWGRVGLPGQNNLVRCGTSLDDAKETFCKKFFDKTKNEFADRKKFKKVAGKYDLLKMDYTANVKDEEDASKANKKKEIPESTLDNELQALIKLICDVKQMEEAVMEMKYDTKKAPLGKLTKEQIKAGYQALKKIEQCITKKETRDKLIAACDAFYTRIPHAFGMTRLPVIGTKEEVHLKIELLEALGDIEIAMKVINDDTNDKLNPLDQHYLALKCQLKPLQHASEEFQMIDRYTQNTHAKTHNQYKMEVTNVFVCNDERQKNFNDCGNRMLLWHGSRLTNWVGILSQGLRVAPPEAPVTGYMFGKGVYFADMSSKSANYCYPTRSKNVGFVLLCEVALGKCNELLAADYDADKLPTGCHSTKGLGKIAPDPTQNLALDDGLIVPLGVSKDTSVNNDGGYTLNYNEFVVYDTKQIKARYLVQLKFNFK